MNSLYPFLRVNTEKGGGHGMGHSRSEVRGDTSIWGGMRGTEPLSTWGCSTGGVDLGPCQRSPGSDADAQSSALTPRPLHHPQSSLSRSPSSLALSSGNRKVFHGIFWSFF